MTTPMPDEEWISPTDRHLACPICDDEGTVLTRHPELDDSLMAEVWLNDLCDCASGQDLLRREEDAWLDRQP